MQARAYEATDFEAAYRLDQACYPPGIAYPRSELREFLTLPGSRAWVAEGRSRDLVGLLIVRKMGRRRGHIITLDVREDHRRRGIGVTLLAEGERWFLKEGVARLRLETAVNNLPAVAFWHKAGFEVVGVLARYYLDRDDAYCMEKELG